MAGDWIKMGTDLHEDERVLEIAKRLRQDTLPFLADEVASTRLAVGALHAFWSWAQAQTANGKINFVDRFVADHISGVPGLGEALVAVGWLVEIDGGGIRIPRFSKHLGQGAKRRAMDQRRKRRVRDASAGCADGMQTECGTREEKIKKGEKRKRGSTARTPDNAQTLSTYVPPEISHERSACSAADPTRLLRAVQLVTDSHVSRRRRPAVLEAVKTISDRRDPVPAVRSIIERASGKANPGGYIATAIIEEAQV